jgi:hypothetical protein
LFLAPLAYCFTPAQYFIDNVYLENGCLDILF